MAGDDKLTMTRVLGAKGMGVTLLSFGFFVGLLLMAFLQYAKFSAPGTCDAQSTYMHSDYNKWRKHMAPPMNGDVGAEGGCGGGTIVGWDQGYGDDADGNPIAIPVDDTALDTLCNTGSGYPPWWAETETVAAYKVQGARFNTCMNNVHRHYGRCTPHIDCTGDFIAAQNSQSFAFIQLGNDVCKYVMPENFLTACEAKTSYADYRDQYKLVLLFTCVALSHPLLISAPTVVTL